MLVCTLKEVADVAYGSSSVVGQKRSLPEGKGYQTDDCERLWRRRAKNSCSSPVMPLSSSYRGVVLQTGSPSSALHDRSTMQSPAPFHPFLSHRLLSRRSDPSPVAHDATMTGATESAVLARDLATAAAAGSPSSILWSTVVRLTCGNYGSAVADACIPSRSNSWISSFTIVNTPSISRQEALAALIDLSAALLRLSVLRIENDVLAQGHAGGHAAIFRQRAQLQIQRGRQMVVAAHGAAQMPRGEAGFSREQCSPVRGDAAHLGWRGGGRGDNGTVCTGSEGEVCFYVDAPTHPAWAGAMWFALPQGSRLAEAVDVCTGVLSSTGKE